MNNLIVGNRIRELRKAKKLTLLEISREAGISIAYLSDIERGNRHGSDTVLEKIAEVLGVTLKDLEVA